MSSSPNVEGSTSRSYAAKNTYTNTETTGRSTSEKAYESPSHPGVSHRDPDAKAAIRKSGVTVRPRAAIAE
jgi:hypothetical protein